MTVIKLGYKHSSASTPLHRATTFRVWCYVSPLNTGLSCSSSAEMRAQTPPLALIPSFQSDCFLTDTASRQGWTIMQIDRDEKKKTRKLHQCCGKRRGSLNVAVCENLYVVAVLTSTAALGSITPTAKEDRKGGALIAACFK